MRASGSHVHFWVLGPATSTIGVPSLEYPPCVYALLLEYTASVPNLFADIDCLPSVSQAHSIVLYTPPEEPLEDSFTVHDIMAHVQLDLANLESRG